MRETNLDRFKKLIKQAYPRVDEHSFFNERSGFNAALKQFSADLGERWVESDRSDFTLYSTEEYLVECIWTYVVSSGSAMTGVRKFFADHDVSSMRVLDYYNGIGLTTVDLLKMGFDEVHYFNDVELQTEATKRIAPSATSWEFHPCRTYDVVMCLETIEHVKEPVPFTQKLIDSTEQYLIEVTSFCSPQHYGHFEKYLVDGELVSGRVASRRVHDLIRESFDLVHSGFNGRPRIWEKR